MRCQGGCQSAQTRIQYRQAEWDRGVAQWQPPYDYDVGKREPLF